MGGGRRWGRKIKNFPVRRKGILFYSAPRVDGAEGGARPPPPLKVQNPGFLAYTVECITMPQPCQGAPQTDEIRGVCSQHS